jgi:hypothetical protein
VFAAHRGEEIDTQGDSFFVAFRSASDALSAAAVVRPRRLVDVDAIGLDRLRSASADGLTALTGVRQHEHADLQRAAHGQPARSLVAYDGR